MDCLHPVTISVDTYDDVQNIFRPQKLLVPCGKCECCVVSTANEWRTRLKIEKDSSDNCYFVTLTYDDDKIPFATRPDYLGNSVTAPCVSKRDIQLFLKRLRKETKLRYFICSEYGPTTYRPHYHGILFGLPRYSSDNLKQIAHITKLIDKCWANGFVQVDDVTYGRISYVTKYMCCKTDLPEYLVPPFRLMSRVPGLGATYLDKKDLIDWHRQNLACYYPEKNYKLRLPRYLKNKIFDDDMIAQISDNIREVRRQSLQRDIQLSSSLGYDNYVDFRHSNIDGFIRKFNNKYKKTRKNI